MKNLTQIQIEELTLLYFASKAELLKGVDGVMNVAKAIQLYLGSTITAALEILQSLTDAETAAINYLLSI